MRRDTPRLRRRPNESADAILRRSLWCGDSAIGRSGRRSDGKSNVFFQRLRRGYNSDGRRNRGDRGRLKNMITAPTVTIERKHVDRYEVRNCARVLITSNESWVVPAEKGERRFMTLTVSDRRANDLVYHAALREQMFDRGGNARLLDYLLREVEIDWNAIRRPLATNALRDQQLATLEPDRAWLLDILHDGALPGDENGEGLVSADALFGNYRAHVGPRAGTKERLGRFLKRYGVCRQRLTSGNHRAYFYPFPALEEIRGRFAADFATPIEWGEQSEWAEAEHPWLNATPGTQSQFDSRKASEYAM